MKILAKLRKNKRKSKTFIDKYILSVIINTEISDRKQDFL